MADVEYDFFRESPYDSIIRKHLEQYEHYGKSPRKDAEKWWINEKTFAFSSDEGEDSNTNEQDTPDNQRSAQLVYSFYNGQLIPRLRAPRDLYANDSVVQGGVMWPSEMEVLPETFTHIDNSPQTREEFNKEHVIASTPMIRGALQNTVFFYGPIQTKCFYKSRLGGHKCGCQVAHFESQDKFSDPALLFESRFESGNLERAVRVGTLDYELYLRPDVYTTKHTQWYYFRVTNMLPSRLYRFTIVNLYKPNSLYNYGMRPLFYSETDARENKVGWRRCGANIKYYRNDYRHNCNGTDKSYYSLTWSCVFPHEKDTVYFAHCYPYTYSYLHKYLAELSADPMRARTFTRRTLCRSLAGNSVPVLTITNFADNRPSPPPPPPLAAADDAADGFHGDSLGGGLPLVDPPDPPAAPPALDDERQAVIVTARVHPGETNASWMMHGLIDFLTGDSADAKTLRDAFIFKIVPMLNPDGVIVGNYRCSLAGRDLNRNYKLERLSRFFPTVQHVKALVRRQLSRRPVALYVDMHGHSRRHNIFAYGCDVTSDAAIRLRSRVYPTMLARTAPHTFSYPYCKFKVQKSKEGTGRIVMWTMGIQNSYTVEASFCGSTLGNIKGYHFTINDFKSMGRHICDALLDLKDPDDTKVEMVLQDLEDRLREDVAKTISKNCNRPISVEEVDLGRFNFAEYSSDDDSSDAESDSSASDGAPELYIRERMLNKKFQRRRGKDNGRTSKSHRSSKGSIEPKVNASTDKSCTIQTALDSISSTPNGRLHHQNIGYHSRNLQTSNSKSRIAPNQSTMKPDIVMKKSLSSPSIQHTKQKSAHNARFTDQKFDSAGVQMKIKRHLIASAAALKYSSRRSAVATVDFDEAPTAPADGSALAATAANAATDDDIGTVDAVCSQHEHLLAAEETAAARHAAARLANYPVKLDSLAGQRVIFTPLCRTASAPMIGAPGEFHFPDYGLRKYRAPIAPVLRRVAPNRRPPPPATCSRDECRSRGAGVGASTGTGAGTDASSGTGGGGDDASKKQPGSESTTNESASYSAIPGELCRDKSTPHILQPTSSKSLIKEAEGGTKYIKTPRLYLSTPSSLVKLPDNSTK